MKHRTRRLRMSGSRELVRCFDCSDYHCRLSDGRFTDLPEFYLQDYEEDWWHECEPVKEVEGAWFQIWTLPTVTLPTPTLELQRLLFLGDHYAASRL